MNIIEHSQSLKFAVIERQGKLYTMERINIMKSDKILVWTSTMMSARSWKGAIYSDRSKTYNRQWTPCSKFPLISS